VDAMKRAPLTTCFIVSLALNLGVAVAIVWERWLRDGFETGKPSVELSLSPSEIRLIQDRFSVLGRIKRQQMLEKRAELLDLVSRNPQDSRACQRTLDEYLTLSGEMERQTFANISQVLASLPTEKRQILLLLLKERISRARGRGRGWSTQGASCCGWASSAHQLRRSNDSSARE